MREFRVDNRRSRPLHVLLILVVLVVLMGCDLFNDPDLEIEKEGQERAQLQSQADSEKKGNRPAVSLDAEEGVIAPEGAGSVLFDNQNLLAVQGGGKSPTFMVPSTSVIIKIQTYHWNPSGNNSTGKISLKADDGSVHGPWETVGNGGQVPNVYWAASPNVTLPAGRYTVIDSDPSTWSQNADSRGEGFVIVYAEAAQ